MNFMRLVHRLANSYLFLLKLKFSAKHETPDAVLIINYQYNLPSWLAGDSGLKDRALYNTLIQNGYAVNVHFNIDNPNDIDYADKTLSVWLNPHHYWFSKARDFSYNSKLKSFLQHLESKYRNVYPSSEESLLWENKEHMHRLMAEHNLRHPRSMILDSEHDNFEDFIGKIGFPCIVKTLNGYSSNGIWLCESIEMLQSLRNKVEDSIIIQEFLNITFDIRVICVHGQVVSFYWRINPKTNSWKPTATQNGATVSFVSLPDSVKILAEEIYTKTKCRTYGVDICFKNDDIETTPYILEFSPIFQPNPTPPSGLVTKSYSKFKKGSWFIYNNKFYSLFVFIYNSLIVLDKINIKFKR